MSTTFPDTAKHRPQYGLIDHSIALSFIQNYMTL